MARSEASPNSVAADGQGTSEVGVGAVPNGERPWLWDLSVGVITDQRHDGCGATCSGVIRDLVIFLPYQGHLALRVGREEMVGDANQVLFLAPGDEYRMSSPLDEGHRELIVRPRPHVLADLVDTRARLAAIHARSRSRSRRAPAHLQTARARFLHWATRASHQDQLQADELLVDLLVSALEEYEPRPATCGQGSAQLIRRTKEFLEAELSSSIRLRDVGQAVGASPTYLTDLFRRSEGVPLHRYLTHLRLARALVEVPHADDLAALALDLGFSSHSHFTAAFRRRFGCTPSWFRQTALGGASGRVWAESTGTADRLDSADCAVRTLAQ